jgi:hypothetical protein
MTTNDHLPPGITSQTLLHLENLAETEAVVYVSGSLVEGLGNTMSDVDVFVVGEARPAGEVVLKKSSFQISVQFVEQRRVDFEYWPESAVTGIANRLTGIRVGHDFVAEKLEPVEELFIHRISVGVPIRHPKRFEALRNQFDLELFRGYLAQQAIHRVDGAIEDICGMIDVGDTTTGILRARELSALAADVFIHGTGRANPLAKWRPRMLERLPTDDRSDELRRKFWEFQFPPVGIVNERAAALRYMEDSVRFANQVVEWVQK